MQYKILALDIATACWWATEHASWTWALKSRTGDSVGMKIVRLRALVKEVIQSEWINIVYYERPAWFHKSALIHEAELIGWVMALLEEMNINYAAVSATEIKKHATGKGVAPKEKMVTAAKLIRPNTDVLDDNQWDAICLYDFVTKMYHK